ncbi:MAG: hypothetical protein D6715_12805 [Calditrichaeota bacterium]|nr:MAG: hypothetical protein D6715_12805 [Calditrichota bacterium]
MGKRSLAIWWIVILLLGIAVGEAYAQQAIDARAAGMAFSNSAAGYGLEQVGMNPAMLAFPYGFNFELNLFSGQFSLFNNALNKAQFDDYFAPGRVLSESDKQQLLQLIPQSGFQASAGARVNTLAVASRYFSLALVGMGSGRVQIPREPFELALQGNQLGREYRFNNVEGLGWAAAGALFSIGIPLHSADGYPVTAVGITAKYLNGFAYFEVLNSEGRLVTTASGIDLNGRLTARSSEGGQGYGLDFGLVTRFGARWQLAFSLSNAISRINWRSNNQLRYFSLKADSLSFPDEFSDSLLVDEDSSAALGAFSTPLARRLTAAFAYRFSRRTVATGQVELPAGGSSLSRGNQRLAFGLETSLISLLPLRTGISLGDNKGLSWALGSGLNLKYWFVDVAVINHGGLKNASSRGITLAVSTRFRF